MAGRGKGQKAENFSVKEVDELLTQLEQEKDWQEVTDAVNEVGGNKRDLVTVKRKWYNLKYPALTKKAAKKTLNSRDERVLTIIRLKEQKELAVKGEGCKGDKGPDHPGKDDPGAAAPALPVSAGEEEEEALTKSMDKMSLVPKRDTSRDDEDEQFWLILEQVKTLHIKTYFKLVTSPDYDQAEDKASYLLSSLAVTNQEKQQIEEATVGQVKNELWWSYHDKRIRTSSFGLVLAAVEDKSYPPFLFKRLLGQYNAWGSEDCEWGTDHKPKAKQQYKKRTGIHIQERGLVLSDSGLLFASPDGAISPDCIVEVKCLSAQTKNDFYLKVVDEEKGSLELKKDHHYWHQIQGTLHLTKAETCRLLVWTPQDLQTLTVTKDPDWAVNLEILDRFYRDKFLPHIMKHQHMLV